MNRSEMRKMLTVLAVLIAGSATVAPLEAEVRSDTTVARGSENDYYRMVTVPVPEGVVLEVGGLAAMPGGRVGVATRRGEVWVLDNAYELGAVRPNFTRFAHGLHEPLGLMYRDGALYTAQRGELTRLVDTTGDGRANVYETVHAWPLSGNYHEYSFGPVLSPNGEMFVTLNLAWIGHGASLARWRGWTVTVAPDGTLTPFASGMRSPAGFGFNLEGDLFYAENQGDWVGSGFITHVERGDFVGNPQGLRWSGEPDSPVRLRYEDIPDTGEPRHVVAQRVPGLKNPAVYLPHGIMGISTSDILVDSTGGAFGPFQGQLFVGDQGHSKIFRVFLENEGGVYQGAAFPFREGFASGVLRQIWGADGSMFVGMTSRGWSATGRAPYALQRLVWTGRTPFEAEKIEARAYGFDVTFTLPVDPASAADLASYEVTSFTYRYTSEYGSPPIERQTHAVRVAEVSDDGRRVRLVVDGVRQGYIHEIKMEGVRSAQRAPLLHDVAYYTLNRLPPVQPGIQAPVAVGDGRVTVRPAPGVVDAPPPDRQLEAPAAKRQTTIPAAWNGQVDQTITVGTRPGLRFSIDRLDVRPGSRVRLVFNNNDDMLHNLVVVLPGTADAVGQAALGLGLDGPGLEYVPPSESVLYHTRLLQPGESDEIFFTAPSEPGEYTFVCTYPGHHIIMRAVMRVGR